MNSLFYYPYASFTEGQSPILKAAALYFDKLYILDPSKASVKTIGPGEAQKEIDFLQREEIKILESVNPEMILEKYEYQILNSIKADLNDDGFLELCKRQPEQRWTLALAKIPKALRNESEFKPMDDAMRNLMGDFSRKASDEVGRYREEFVEYRDYAESGKFYTEYRGTDQNGTEYRYADMPLALGESIIINHALFASLLHLESTPFTDDVFHNKVLKYKLQKATAIPLIEEAINSRNIAPRLKSDYLAGYMLTDHQLTVPTLNPNLPIEELFEFRENNKDELDNARRRINQLSRSIKEMPLTNDFEKEVSVQIGQIDKEMQDLEKTRNAWLNSKKAKFAGVGFTAVGATLTFILSATPVAIPLMIGGALSLLGDAIFPVIESWFESKESKTENGLHYFMKLTE